MQNFRLKGVSRDQGLLGPGNGRQRTCHDIGAVLPKKQRLTNPWWRQSRASLSPSEGHSPTDRTIQGGVTQQPISGVAATDGDANALTEVILGVPSHVHPVFSSFIRSYVVDLAHAFLRFAHTKY